MYKYTVYMYTCSSLHLFMHIGQPIPRSHLADVIPTQALRTLRSPRDKRSWESCTTADFPESIQAGGFDFFCVRREREGGKREIGGVIMMRGYVCERKLLADAKIR